VKYRKKPVVIEAEQWWDVDILPEGLPEIVPYQAPEYKLSETCRHCAYFYRSHGWIDTLEGGHIVCPGDWIINGVAGERYPCKPDIFEQIYEKVGH
jgi:hypothetical protein